MSDAAFYFYHIAHMAKHFEESGIGLRFFLDLWILDHFVECNAAAREALLMEGGLLPFSQAMRKASEAWFSGETADEATVRIQKYVVASGIYGSKHHRVAIERAKNGTSGKQVKRRIFMPYQELKKQYPVLEEHPVLTPAYEVRRWAHLLKHGRLQRAADELKEIRELKESDVQAVEQLMTDVGLNGPVSS